MEMIVQTPWKAFNIKFKAAGARHADTWHETCQDLMLNLREGLENSL